MNGILAVMLLVSCADNFDQCNVADDLLTVYPNVSACEKALMPSVQTISSQGQQVFGKCVSTRQADLEEDPSIYWHVSNNGDFYVDIDADSKQQPNHSNITTIAMKPLKKPASS